MRILSGIWSGIAVVVFLLIVIGGSITLTAMTSTPVSLSSALTDPYLISVIRFTIGQAVLSTTISVGLALIVTRALARRAKFPGRRLLILLMGLPVVMPVIVAIFGITAVFGKSGLLNELLSLFGVEQSFTVYGLTGILVAHTFFNLPLAIRLLLPAWESIPRENWRLASMLGMSSRQLFRLLEWPSISDRLPGICLVVFLLCFTSFAVVLTLGGGPAATTIEVAIYQALRYDFELSQAALLALLQLSLCTVAALGLLKWFRVFAATSGRKVDARDRPDIHSTIGKATDFFCIGICAIFLLLPITMIFYSGIRGPIYEVISDPILWLASARSLIIAILATVISMLLAMGLIKSVRFLREKTKQQKGAELALTIGSMTVAIPPMVIGTGFFLIALRTHTLAHATLIMIALVNAIMVLPYLLRSISPPYIQAGEQYYKLCRHLGLSGLQRFRLIDWPIIRKPTAFAVGLGGALSFGDMGVAALFDTDGQITLPVMLYHQLGAYQFNEASVTAVFLLLLCVSFFWAINQIIGR